MGTLALLRMIGQDAHCTRQGRRATTTTTTALLVLWDRGATGFRSAGRTYSVVVVQSMQTAEHQWAYWWDVAVILAKRCLISLQRLSLLEFSLLVGAVSLTRFFACPAKREAQVNYSHKPLL